MGVGEVAKVNLATTPDAAEDRLCRLSHAKRKFAKNEKKKCNKEGEPRINNNHNM